MQTLIMLAPSLMAAVGIWVQLNGEVQKLKGRVYHLEAERGEIKDMLKQLRDAVEEIRISIASK